MGMGPMHILRTKKKLNLSFIDFKVLSSGFINKQFHQSCNGICLVKVYE